MKTKADKHRDAGTLAAFRARRAASRAGTAQHQAEFSHAKKTPRTFEEVWRDEYEARGFQYGADALEQVRMGWDMALKFSHAKTP